MGHRRPFRLLQTDDDSLFQLLVVKTLHCNNDGPTPQSICRRRWDTTKRIGHHFLFLLPSIDTPSYLSGRSTFLLYRALSYAFIIRPAHVEELGLELGLRLGVNFLLFFLSLSALTYLLKDATNQ